VDGPRRAHNGGKGPQSAAARADGQPTPRFPANAAGGWPNTTLGLALTRAGQGAVTVHGLRATVMRSYACEGNHSGTLAAATAAAPYIHARLNVSDIHVRHSFDAESDAELAQELIVAETRLQLAKTIEGKSTADTRKAACALVLWKPPASDT
jgi:hypothetical protein